MFRAFPAGVCLLGLAAAAAGCPAGPETEAEQRGPDEMVDRGPVRDVHPLGPVRPARAATSGSKTASA